MEFIIYTVGKSAEAVDDYGVWSACEIIENHQDHVLVTFPPWPESFNRKIYDSSDIRETMMADRQDKKRKPGLSIKV
jgi:hypothetical protein